MWNSGSRQKSFAHHLDLDLDSIFSVFPVGSPMNSCRSYLTGYPWAALSMRVEKVIQTPRIRQIDSEKVAAGNPQA
jgi:hypothetical protein